MAIQFARCAYVSRSTGGNACRKASYNQREKIRCERTGELFSFKAKGGNVYHEILLPSSAHEKFKNSAVLWNEVEACEKRINSQLAKEFVIALPDDLQITLEDRIELTKRFSSLFVERGVAVQLDIHAPHQGEKNWHAHLLVTTRRFSEEGLTFGAKARDLDPVVRRGTVVEGDLWGEIWRDLQNAYFEEKGYDVKVDPIGLIPQEHLGPVRMRQHLNEAVTRAQLLKQAHEELVRDPSLILQELTRTKAVFTERDVEHFLSKHVPLEERKEILGKVLEHSHIVPLYERETQKETGTFTTLQVRCEEEKVLRFSEKIARTPRSPLTRESQDKGQSGKTLSPEQRDVYDESVNSNKNLLLIQGRAGVGKSYVMEAISKAHEEDGYRVLGLAPTHKVALVLKENGFKEAKTCHSYLFSLKNNRESLNSKTLVMVDEAGMLGTSLTVELLHAIKRKGAKLILVGDDRQLPSVERGGVFTELIRNHGGIELKEIRRQTINWQKAVSESLSEGLIKEALTTLEAHKAICWNPTKEEALSTLLKEWGRESFLYPHQSRVILASRNVDVDALNQGAREHLKHQGRIGGEEIICSTSRGRMPFTEGDRIHLTKTDQKQDLVNGSFGTIEKIDFEGKKITLQLDKGERVTIDSLTYEGLRHGYATTVYKSQGSTVDHVYVFHSKATSSETQYVALTRHSKSVKLYVSKEETPSLNHLIQQIERSETQGMSLRFMTLEDIEKKKEDPSLVTHLKERLNTWLTDTADLFHKNSTFYHVEKPHQFVHTPPEVVRNQEEPAQINLQTQERENPTLFSEEVLRTSKSFKAIEVECKKILYQELRANKQNLTPVLREQMTHRAERAAELLSQQYTFKETQPTPEQIKFSLFRAKYELKRIPEIRQDLMKEWEESKRFDPNKDPLLAHMAAVRQATIEGRIYVEAEQVGKMPSPRLPTLAAQEVQRNQGQEKKISHHLSETHSFSQKAALECVHSIIRHQETQGEKPSQKQVELYVHIIQHLENKIPFKESDPAEILFLKRKEGDLLLRSLSSVNNKLSDKEFYSREILKCERQAKFSLEFLKAQLKEEGVPLCQKEKILCS